MARERHTLKSTVHIPKTVVGPNECYHEMSFFTRTPSALHGCTQHWARRHARAVQQGAAADNGQQRLTARRLLSPPAPPRPIVPAPLYRPLSAIETTQKGAVCRRRPLLHKPNPQKHLRCQHQLSGRPNNWCWQKLQPTCGNGNVVALTRTIDWRCCGHQNL